MTTSTSTALAPATNEGLAKMHPIPAELECYLPPLPRVLQRLIYEHAFNFSHDDDSSLSEMHYTFTIYPSLAPIFTSFGLNADPKVIEDRILNRLVNDFINVTTCDGNGSECPEGILDIKNSNKTLLKKIQMFANQFHCNCQQPKPIIYRIPLDSATFLAAHANKNALVKYISNAILCWKRRDESMAVEILKVVLNKENVNLLLDNQRRTPLHASNILGTTECLVKHGAEIEALDKENETPLHYAARLVDPRIVSFLCQQNANLEARNIRGETPIFKAVQQKAWFNAKALIESGAKLAVMDHNGKSLLQHTLDNYHFEPYHVAVTREKAKEVLDAIQAANPGKGNSESRKIIAVIVIALIALYIIRATGVINK